MLQSTVWVAALGIAAATLWAQSDQKGTQQGVVTDVSKDDSEQLSIDDAKTLRDEMKKNNVTLAKAVKKAENEKNGKAICAKVLCDKNESASRQPDQAVVEVQLVTDQDPNRLVLVNLKKGSITEDRGGRHGKTNNPGSREPIIASKILKAHEVIGHSVKNGQGESLGEIQDVAIHPRSGRVVYAVLSYGGFLGMGDKLFAVPWNSLAIQQDDAYVLDIDKDKLKNAPGFDKNNWPQMADQRWGKSIHDYYGQKPYWESKSMQGHRAQLTASEAKSIKNSLESHNFTLEKAITTAERYTKGDAVTAECIPLNQDEQQRLLVAGAKDNRKGGIDRKLVVAEVCCLVEQSPARLSFVTVNSENGEVLQQKSTSLGRSLGSQVRGDTELQPPLRASRICKADEILGKSVKNRQGESLGEIEDIALDPQLGRAAYAVLSFGGFLDIGDKLFAVPFSALEEDSKGDAMILDVDKQKLKDAPGFNKDNWPQMADERWGRDIHSYYGEEPYWEVGVNEEYIEEGAWKSGEKRND